MPRFWVTCCVLSNLFIVGHASGDVFTSQEQGEKTGTFLTTGNTCYFYVSELET